MIKINKPGQKEFHGFCKWCGCEFTYEISDLKLYKVSCPTCGKDYYHPSMVQDTTIPGDIVYQQPSDSTDPCAGCVWRSSLEHSLVYVGDTPCTWCSKNKFNITTCEQPSVKAYITPHINQLDAYLSATATSGKHSDVKAYNKTENKKDITKGVVMSTIHDACCEGYPDDHAVGKGLMGGHIVGNNNAYCGSSSRNSGTVESHGDAKKRCRGKR